jgi:hypothetical protein
MTPAVFPDMRAQEAGRIMNVSSGARRAAVGGYAVSTTLVNRQAGW